MELPIVKWGEGVTGKKQFALLSLFIFAFLQGNSVLAEGEASSASPKKITEKEVADADSMTGEAGQVADSEVFGESGASAEQMSSASESGAVLSGGATATGDLSGAIDANQRKLSWTERKLARIEKRIAAGESCTGRCARRYQKLKARAAQLKADTTRQSGQVDAMEQAQESMSSQCMGPRAHRESINAERRAQGLPELSRRDYWRGVRNGEISSQGHDRGPWTDEQRQAYRAGRNGDPLPQDASDVQRQSYATGQRHASRGSGRDHYDRGDMPSSNNTGSDSNSNSPSNPNSISATRPTGDSSGGGAGQSQPSFSSGGRSEGSGLSNFKNPLIEQLMGGGKGSSEIKPNDPSASPVVGGNDRNNEGSCQGFGCEGLTTSGTSRRGSHDSNPVFVAETNTDFLENTERARLVEQITQTQAQIVAAHGAQLAKVQQQRRMASLSGSSFSSSSNLANHSEIEGEERTLAMRGPNSVEEKSKSGSAEKVLSTGENVGAVKGAKGSKKKGDDGWDDEEYELGKDEYKFDSKNKKTEDDGKLNMAKFVPKYDPRVNFEQFEEMRQKDPTFTGAFGPDNFEKLTLRYQAIKSNMEQD